MPNIKSPSKLNLFLEVTGKLPNGYHSIDSLFVCIDLCDDMEITFLPSNIIKVCTDHPEVPDGHANIVYKAIESVRSTFDIASGVNVSIAKKIPVGGGLGGGSGNAAACIRALCEEWEIDMRDPRLKELVPQLGADIPFFLYSAGCARCRGIGEQIDDIILTKKLWFVLIHPNIPIDTGSIYKKIILTNNPLEPTIIYRGILQSNSRTISSGFFNRMETVVIPQYPIIKTLKDTLCALGCENSLMSGSGSTVFGLARDQATAEMIADALKKSYPEWFITAASSIENTITGS